MILVTGAGSGFGKYLHEDTSLETSAMTRQSSFDDSYSTIVHCAFNSRRVNSSGLYQYIKDSLFLTKLLLDLKFDKFIFLSTVDVYSEGNTSEDIELPLPSAIYPLTKLMCEEIIKHHCSNYLIMRCSGLVGRYMRKNNLVRLLSEEEPELTLSAQSEVNLVPYKILCDMITEAITRDIRGTFNVANKESITMHQIAQIVHKSPSFGAFTYKVGDINVQKMKSFFSVGMPSSLDVIREF